MINLRIAVAHESNIIRSGLVQTLKTLPNIRVQIVEIGAFDRLSETLKLHSPEILVVNPLMLIAQPQLLKQPKFKIVAFSIGTIENSIAQQFDDVWDVNFSIQQIVQSLQALTKKNSSKIENEQISQREREIIVLVVKGLTNKEIADKLFISVNTVVTHRRNIARKLQIHSPAGLTIYAIVNNLVDVNDV